MTMNNFGSEVDGGGRESKSETSEARRRASTAVTSGTGGQLDSAIHILIDATANRGIANAEKTPRLEGAKDAARNPHRNSSYYFQLIKPEIGILFVAVCCSFVMTGGNMALPLILQRAFQLAVRMNTDVADTKDWEALTNYIIYLSLILIILPLVNGVRVWLTGLAGERFLRRLRDIVFAVLLQQPISFFDNNMSGELVNRVASDTEVMQKLVSFALPSLLYSIMLMMSSFVIMFYIDWHLASVFWGAFPLAIILFVWETKSIKKKKMVYQELLAQAGAMISETVTQIRTVRAFAAESRTQKAFHAILQIAYEDGLKLIFIRAGFDALETFLFNICYAGFFILAVFMIIWGKIKMDNVLVLLIYVTQVIAGSVELMMGVAHVAEATGASTRTFDILQTRHEDIVDKARFRRMLKITNPSLEHSAKDFDGSIVFDNVCFSYGRSPRNVLTDVSFEVKSGQTVALVGASGGGKSTIVSIIERFYNINSGAVLVGGRNVANIDAAWMRKYLVSIVAQEPSLFQGTVRSNIAYGRPEASKARVEEVARQANAHDFVSEMDKGYGTLVGERGVKLSGGQKQRIAIARALLMESKILLLDEATSALDAESESLVHDAFDRLIADSGTTVLVIAHRLSTIRSADVILVISDGRIVERGSHEALMAMEQGAYRKLVDRQLTIG